MDAQKESSGSAFVFFLGVHFVPKSPTDIKKKRKCPFLTPLVSSV
jgi:hypothetical protein